MMVNRATALLALKNVNRNARRSGIALLAVGFGIVAMLLAGGFIEDILHGMREETIETHLGHIQVTRPRYMSEGIAAPFEFLLPDGRPERATIENAPRVVVLSPRLSFNGLISLGETTLSFHADAVEPNKEKTLARQLKITAGQNLIESEAKQIIIGHGLALSLGAKLGDKVTLVVNTPRGGVNAIEVTIRGIYSTGTKAYDDTALRLPLKTAQQLLRVKGTHRWVLLLDRTESTHDMVNMLKQRLDAKQFDVVPWTELADFYNKTVTLFSRQVTVMKLIIAAIIVMSISNTMTMSAIERTGEIGTAMAIGNTRRDVLTLFLTEGFILGVAGAIIGVLAGAALAYLISLIGIPMPPPPGANEGFTAKIRVTMDLVAQALILAVVTTLIATIYPAWKASRMIIVDALRQNR